MKNVKNIFGAFLTMVMVTFFVCSNAMSANARTIELNENCDAVYETFLKNMEIGDVESNFEYAYRMINHFEKEATLCVKEKIVNSAGNEIVVMYPYEVNWQLSEDEILAKILFLEGGTLEEKNLIAKILVGKKLDPEFPDDMKGILCIMYSYFLNTETWNEFANPTEEDYAIAKAVLESPEVSEYKYYELAYLKDTVRIPYTECYELEHFVFFK